MAIQFAYDYSEIDFGETPVENLVIKHYIPIADADEIKVYLSALYFARTNGNAGIEEIAQLNSMTVSQVLDAFKFWERNELAAVERVKTEKEDDEDYIVTLFSMRSHLMKQRVISNGVVTEDDQLSKLVTKARGSAVSKSEFRFYEQFIEETDGAYDALKAVLTLYFKDLGLTRFTDVKKFLSSIMKSQNYDPEQIQIDAQNYFKSNKYYSSVLRLLGINRAANPSEKSMMNAWLDELRLSEKDVLKVVEERAPHSKNPSVGFLNDYMVETYGEMSEERKRELQFKRWKKEITGSRYGLSSGEKRLMEKWLGELGLTQAEIEQKILEYTALTKNMSISNMDKLLRASESEVEDIKKQLSLKRGGYAAKTRAKSSDKHVEDIEESDELLDAIWKAREERNSKK